MTKDEKKILRLIVPLAPSESDMIWIDFENNLFVRVHTEGQAECIADFSKHSHRIRTILNALQEKQCIVRSGALKNYMKIQYDGYYHKTLSYEKFQSFMIKSVIVPIAVSLITSGILGCIQRWLIQRRL